RRGGPVFRDAGRGPHRRPPAARGRPAAPVPGRVGRRGHVRVRAPQPGRAAPVLRRAGAGGAPRRADRPAGGGDPAEPGAARRPRPVLRQGGAARRRAAVGPGRLPVPPEVGRLPPRARRDARPVGRRRVRRRPPPPADGRDRPADHRHPPVTGHGGVSPAFTAPDPAAAAAGLVARTRRVDHDLDLLALAGADGVLFERSRTGLAGRGVALRVPVRAAEAVLGAIAVDDAVGAPGTGPVAFGALPFRPDPEAELIVPEVVWGRAEDGTRWITRIAPADAIDAVSAAEPGPLDPASPVAAAPARITVTPVRGAAWWCDLVAEATAAMKGAGPDGLQKVVLAREVVVESDPPFDRAAVLARLRTTYPGCFLFLVDGFLGASPERLVGRAGDVVRAQPMAGTAPRGGDPAAVARLAAGLLASPTYRHEHLITIDMVHDTLL